MNNGHLDSRPDPAGDHSPNANIGDLGHYLRVRENLAEACRDYIAAHDGFGFLSSNPKERPCTPVISEMRSLMEKFEQLMGKQVLEAQLPGVSKELKLAAVGAHLAVRLSVCFGDSPSDKLSEAIDSHTHRTRVHHAVAELKKFLIVNADT